LCLLITQIRLLVPRFVYLNNEAGRLYIRNSGFAVAKCNGSLFHGINKDVYLSERFERLTRTRNGCRYMNDDLALALDSQHSVDDQTANETCDSLATQIVDCRSWINQLQDALTELEGRAAAIVGGTDNGHTIKGDFYAITATNSYRRSLDAHGLDLLMVSHDGIDNAEAIEKVFPVTRVFNEIEYDALRHSNPDLFAQVARAVSISERRETITVDNVGVLQ
jgi:hypothetical protein